MNKRKVYILWIDCDRGEDGWNLRGLYTNKKKLKEFIIKETEKISEYAKKKRLSYMPDGGYEDDWKIQSCGLNE
jgi:hypothetical protein